MARKRRRRSYKRKKWGKIGAPHSRKRKLWLKRIARKRWR